MRSKINLFFKRAHFFCLFKFIQSLKTRRNEHLQKSLLYISPVKFRINLNGGLVLRGGTSRQEQHSAQPLDKATITSSAINPLQPSFFFKTSINMASKTKFVSKFAAFADDSDSDCESTCSCHTPKKSAFEEKLLRSRFWVWPEDESASGAWPCRCSDPGFAVEGDGEKTFWECSHGKWEFLSSWDSVPALPEDHSLDQCRGGSCTNHGLYTGLLLELHLSTQMGMGWGDIIWEWEQEHLASMTPQERLALAVKQAAEDKARQKAIADAEIRKAKEIAQIAKRPLQRMYDRRTGKPLACKWAEHPAENGWPAGCGKHKEGVCPYFHTDEAEWAIIKGTASGPIGAGGGRPRDFSALKASGGSGRRW